MNADSPLIYVKAWTCPVHVIIIESALTQGRVFSFCASCSTFGALVLYEIFEVYH